MKLINRHEFEVEFEVVPRKDVVREPFSFMISFYRTDLDGSYQKMIIDMMDVGCFDDFMGSVIRFVMNDGMFDCLG